ncbi:hypothetical protein KC363_g59 [Hortaea werneckii]|nr:hypothetical protein KC363_g59 [Hortaea werneckii]
MEGTSQSLLDLPTELQLTIFECLPTQALRNLRHTCKSMAIVGYRELTKIAERVFGGLYVRLARPPSRGDFGHHTFTPGRQGSRQEREHKCCSAERQSAEAQQPFAERSRSGDRRSLGPSLQPSPGPQKGPKSSRGPSLSCVNWPEDARGRQDEVVLETLPRKWHPRVDDRGNSYQLERYGMTASGGDCIHDGVENFFARLFNPGHDKRHRHRTKKRHIDGNFMFVREIHLANHRRLEESPFYLIVGNTSVRKSALEPTFAKINAGLIKAADSLVDCFRH